MARSLINLKSSMRLPSMILTVNGAKGHDESCSAQEFGLGGTRWHGVGVA
jgi:hypothetical protein